MANPRASCHWYVSVIRDTARQRNLPRVVVSDKISRSSVASVEAVEAFVITDDLGSNETRRNIASVVRRTVYNDNR